MLPATLPATSSSWSWPRLREPRRRWPSTRRSRHAPGWRLPDADMTTPLKTVVNRPIPPDNEKTPAFDPDNRSAALAALALLAAAATMAILYWARAVFIPIVLSLLISFALDPLVRVLMRIRLPRTVASGLVVAALAGTIGYTVYGLADDAAAIVAAVPEAATKLRQTLRREQGQEDSANQQVQRAADELQRTADEAAGPSTAPRGVQRVQVEEPAIDIRQYVMWGSAGAIAFGGEAVLIVFFVFFLLASGDLFKRKLVKIAGPSLQRRKVTVQILDEINAQIERFLLRSEEHTSELQSPCNLVCRLLLEKKKMSTQSI